MAHIYLTRVFIVSTGTERTPFIEIQTIVSKYIQDMSSPTTREVPCIDPTWVGKAVPAKVQNWKDIGDSMRQASGENRHEKLCDINSSEQSQSISVVILIRTDTTLDHSQKAEKVWTGPVFTLKKNIYPIQWHGAAAFCQINKICQKKFARGI